MEKMTRTRREELIEKYVDGANKFYKQTTFYIKDGKKYVSNEHFDDTTNRQKPQFIERISYYDQETKPLWPDREHQRPVEPCAQLLTGHCVQAIDPSKGRHPQEIRFRCWN